MLSSYSFNLKIHISQILLFQILKSGYLNIYEAKLLVRRNMINASGWHLYQIYFGVYLNLALQSPITMLFVRDPKSTLKTPQLTNRSPLTTYVNMIRTKITSNIWFIYTSNSFCIVIVSAGGDLFTILEEIMVKFILYCDLESSLLQLMKTKSRLWILMECNGIGIGITCIL